MPDKVTTWVEIMNFCKEIAPYATFFGLGWKAIDKAFKFMSEGRERQMRDIVKQETEPLNDKIDKLSESIFELKQSMR